VVERPSDAGDRRRRQQILGETPPTMYKNSSGDEIANVNFYAVRPETTRIR